MTADPSNGHERVATEFLASRGRSSSPAIGTKEVRRCARTLAPGAAVADLGCGSGIPISQALLEEGVDVHGIDAAPSLVAEFRRNFPHARVACESVLDSSFFGRRFSGAVAWGLMFLLRPDEQRRLIARIGDVLVPGGQISFTSPAAPVVWNDIMTGLESRSLGAPEYRALLAAAGIAVTREYEGEGSNYHYEGVKRQSSAVSC
jgi:SAM-dependent methyltransferase